MNRCDVWTEDKWQQKTTNRTQIAICCSLAIHLLSDQSTFWYRSRTTDLHIHVWIYPALSVCCIYPTHQTMKRKGEWKEKILMTIHIFSVPQNFFYPHKDKNPSLQQQRLSNFLYTKVEKLLLGKGWIWHVSVNFYQASIKALRLPTYHCNTTIKGTPL